MVQQKFGEQVMSDPPHMTLREEEDISSEEMVLFWRVLEKVTNICFKLMWCIDKNWLKIPHGAKFLSPVSLEKIEHFQIQIVLLLVAQTFSLLTLLLIILQESLR